MEYNFTEIEHKWRKWWQDEKIYEVTHLSDRPKYYVLDMFPYPSGDGLHVGHPLGYLASDIVSRHKRMKGYNVLHPMGYDAFGLSAEQYAIKHGIHPEKATRDNVTTFRRQMENIGFSYDWSRELSTCDTGYYKWTQWIFLQLFEHYYDNKAQKAQPIAQLEAHFEQYGTQNLQAVCTEPLSFSANEWHGMSKQEQRAVLMNYRLAYSSFADVWFSPSLATVLANDEVSEGIAIRDGLPVERKRLRQWFLRTTAYAQRLLQGLDDLEWSESLKEMQRNWIGRSEGALVDFPLVEPKYHGNDNTLKVFTTRPDTIFGVTFMVIAPEHELVNSITTPEQSEVVAQYLKYTQSRSERERMSDVKTVTGAFTGAYCQNPFNGQAIPIWISEYVLAGYGTGAIMAVPSSDERDYRFATHFGLPVVCVIEGTEEMNDPTEKKRGKMIHSDFLNGMETEQAIGEAVRQIETNGFGKGKINYRMRDAGFSRQRYWGEPFPIVYQNDMAYAVPESELPVELPFVESYKPTGTGKSPLAAIESWTITSQGERETDTMPGFAGSSWYYLRYMDPQNTEQFVSPDAERYWGNVDFYIGGAEHAVGHLLYSRTWYKFLYDKGLVSHEEPFKKLVNQGMIQGRSSFVYRVKNENKFVSAGLKDQYPELTEIHVNVNLVSNDILDVEGFKKWRPDWADAEFELENGKYICGWAIEKMSKSKYNVVNPDDLVAKYGADCFRMYEMFLGPITDSKPWGTDGMEGVSRFLRKFWKLFFDNQGRLALNADAPSADELRVLHQTIKKVNADIERFSLNTCISTFMECTNRLGELHCRKHAILEPLVRLIAPFAVFTSEELWHLLGNNNSVHQADYPTHDEQYLKVDVIEYPVQINGKVRERVTIGVDANDDEIRELVLRNETVAKWVSGVEIKKFVCVKGRIVNIVV